MAGDWRVSWSHQLEGKVGAIATLNEGDIIASGVFVRLLNDFGVFIW